MRVSRSKLYLIKSVHIRARFTQQDSVPQTPILGVNGQFVNFKGVSQAPRVEWAFNCAFLQATELNKVSCIVTKHHTVYLSCHQT